MENPNRIPDNPLSTEQVAVATANRVVIQQDREIRTLKWKLKQLGKQNGRQGDTIYRLRNENAALREHVGQNVIGDLHRLREALRISRNATDVAARKWNELEAENDRLREQLAKAGKPDVKIENNFVGDGLLASGRDTIRSAQQAMTPTERGPLQAAMNSDWQER